MERDENRKMNMENWKLEKKKEKQEEKTGKKMEFQIKDEKIIKNILFIEFLNLFHSIEYFNYFQVPNCSPHRLLLNIHERLYR